MTNQNQAQAPHDERPRVEGVSRNEKGQLVLKMVEHPDPFVDVQVARCFPWTIPDGYISIREQTGREIVFLETLDQLDPAGRDLIRAELHDKVFNPKLKRIVSHNREFGVTSITAETDRGQVTFQIATRDDVRVLSSSRALFRDPDGNVYELTDINSMDEVSRKWLMEYF